MTQLPSTLPVPGLSKTSYFMPQYYQLGGNPVPHAFAQGPVPIPPSEKCESELEYFFQIIWKGVFQIMTIPLRIAYYCYYMRVSLVAQQ